ncbi:unnamed protein product [Arctogadus glacialis]
MEQPIGPLSSFDYDLLVVGAGSGGQAVAKEAVGFNKRVLVIDPVTPFSECTTSVLGWSSVTMATVRKLLHRASQLGQDIQDSQKYGWRFKETASHSWGGLSDALSAHAESCVLGVRRDLTECGAAYLRAGWEMLAPHVVEVTDTDGRKSRLSVETLVIDPGERPRYPGVPGDGEHCVTSNELFSRPRPPGRTLVVGGSPEGVECAGFLSGLGHEVTLMLPTSDLLPGFDLKMSQKIENHMLVHGVHFLYEHTLSKVEQIGAQDGGVSAAALLGAPGGLRASLLSRDGPATQEDFDTVLLAVGIEPSTSNIGLERVGVKCCPDGRVLVNELDQTSVDHVYCLSSSPSSSPSSSSSSSGPHCPSPVLRARSGRLLAHRLYGGPTPPCDYSNIPLVLFTPLEYSACGLSEERANATFGEANIEVYHSYYWPLEWTVPARDKNSCYVKVVCHVPDQERVVGLHLMGPHAGDIVQGFSAAMTSGLTKRQLDATAGLQPTAAQVLTSLTVTQRESEAMMVRGNC